MKLTKTQLKEIIKEEIKKTNLTEASIMFTLDDVSDAQDIAGASKLSYEAGWNAIAGYLVSTMGLVKANQLILNVEKHYKKLTK
jgi:hypothetical protein